MAPYRIEKEVKEVRGGGLKRLNMWVEEGSVGIEWMGGGWEKLGNRNIVR